MGPTAGRPARAWAEFSPDERPRGGGGLGEAAPTALQPVPTEHTRLGREQLVTIQQEMVAVSIMLIQQRRQAIAKVRCAPTDFSFD